MSPKNPGILTVPGTHNAEVEGSSPSLTTSQIKHLSHTFSPYPIVELVFREIRAFRIYDG